MFAKSTHVVTLIQTDPFHHSNLLNPFTTKSSKREPGQIQFPCLRDQTSATFPSRTSTSSTTPTSIFTLFPSHQHAALTLLFFRTDHLTVPITQPLNSLRAAVHWDAIKKKCGETYKTSFSAGNQNKNVSRGLCVLNKDIINSGRGS